MHVIRSLWLKHTRPTTRASGSSPRASNSADSLPLSTGHCSPTLVLRSRTRYSVLAPLMSDGRALQPTPIQMPEAVGQAALLLLHIHLPMQPMRLIKRPFQPNSRPNTINCHRQPCTCQSALTLFLPPYNIGIATLHLFIALAASPSSLHPNTRHSALYRVMLMPYN